jgi:ABC-type dipeptide/oligopeptide/nickel transport system ATPase subunit
MNGQPILQLENISFVIEKKKQIHQILKEINLEIYESEIFGLTGESGSGKTTIGKIIAGLEERSSGKKYFRGKEFDGIESGHKIQILFQNYSATYDPLQKIDGTFNEFLRLSNQPFIHWYKIKKEILNLVGLSDDVLSLYPYQLSGGQLQRLALAKLLILKPEFLILDEPFASQDVVSILNLINLFRAINKKFGVTLFIISHELPYLLNLADRIGFIKNGSIIEILSVSDKKQFGEIIKPNSDYAQFLFKSFGISFS